MPVTKFETVLGGPENEKALKDSIKRDFFKEPTRALLGVVAEIFPDQEDRRQISLNIVKLGTVGSHFPESLNLIQSNLSFSDTPESDFGFLDVAGFQPLNSQEAKVLVAAVSNGLNAEQREQAVLGLEGQVEKVKEKYTPTDAKNIAEEQMKAVILCLREGQQVS